jgi:hypothetical protein
VVTIGAIKLGIGFQCCDQLRRGDQPCAFERPGRAGMARAPQEILVISLYPHVVPAGIADVPVDHAVWRGEFIGWMREAADHHHWRARGAAQPG